LLLNGQCYHGDVHPGCAAGADGAAAAGSQNATVLTGAGICRDGVFLTICAPRPTLGDPRAESRKIREDIDPGLYTTDYEGPLVWILITWGGVYHGL